MDVRLSKSAWRSAELFAGTIRAVAAKHGLLTPANDFLYRRIREMEAAY